MQQTSDLYRSLLADDNHWFETSVVIGDTGDLITEGGEKILFGGLAIVVSRTGPESGYPENYIFSVSTHSKMLENKPEIGKCISQEIEVKMLNPSGDIPRMGVVIPYVRVCTEEEQSEWIQQGVFFVDTREITHNHDGLDVLTLHGFDAMLKANQGYTESQLNWPATDIDVVREIASILDVEVDSRTVEAMTEGYSIPDPGSYTLIEVLGFIASMYLGSFIISETGELRLVSLLELPPETRYLIDNAGDAITFGIDREGYEVTVAGGEIASFETEGVCDISELVATIEPQQDLHGYANPWPAGGGKNLINQDGTDTNNGYVHKAYINTSGTVSQAEGNWDVMEYVPVEPNTTYTLSGTTANNVNGYAEYNESKTRVANGVVNTSPYTFTTGASTRYVRFNRQYSTDTQVQLEKGSSATTYQSFANECPISGWVGLSGKIDGKNLLSDDYFINSSGTAYTLGQSVVYTTRELYLKANVNYTLQVDGKSRFTLYIRDTNNSSTRISNYATSHNVTVTVEKDGLYALYCYKSSSYGTFTSKDDINWWQLEVGSTATAVERYRTKTLFSSWQDEAGTVFGANVDVVGGVLTVDRAKLVLDESIPSGSSGFRNITELEDGVRAEYYPYRATGRTDSVIISDKFKSGAISTGVPFVVGASASNPRMYVTLPLEYNTEAKIRAWFSDNPTEFVYYLAQPQTYQLTGNQLTTFAEQNNIYVDTGSIEEVKYLIPTSEVTRILV